MGSRNRATEIALYEHTLEIYFPSGPVTFEADPTQMQQVLVNLLTNAAKYTNPGGRIWLTSEDDDNDIVLRVRDDGQGIAPESISYLFELFWQSPNAAAHAHGGRGIGLALVRQIVESHDGSISASSSGLGQGSDFVVRLPKTANATDRGGN